MSEIADSNQNTMTERERLDAEIAAINVLQQVGVSFKVPLLKNEINRYMKRNSLFGKVCSMFPGLNLPKGVDVIKTKMPDPSNPDEQIDYYEAEISIRPMYLATIDAIRARRLKIEIKDHEFKKHLNSNDPSDTYILQYTDEVCEALAIATLNSDSNTKEIKSWAKFYKAHLTNQRFLKLTSVIVMLMDHASFRASTRLILGLGTTAPREASRVEKTQSKD